MREESWYKWLFIAMFLHVLIIGAFTIPIKGGHKKIDLSSYYSVNLVGEIGGQTPEAAAPPVPAPAQKQVAASRAETKKAKQPPPRHPQSTTKERSLAPVKKQAPRAIAKDDVRWLDKRIREMKNEDTTSIDEKIRQMRKQYMDVSSASKSRGSGLPASGGSTPLDPALGKYEDGVLGIIQDAWYTPPSAKKDLETLVTITVRKDGRITDWQIDQRSGNRAYDEPLTRAIRSIDKLPPIPASLNTDSIDIPIRFHPPGGDVR
jgi:TonB family protein